VLNWLVPLFQWVISIVNVIGDGVRKCYESTKESKHGLISFKSTFYMQN
jgi:hypothetical protein